jgi:hypothetical protein
MAAPYLDGDSRTPPDADALDGDVIDVEDRELRIMPLGQSRPGHVREPH